MTEYQDLRDMTPAALAVFGMPSLAYIKPVTVNGVTAYAVHTADGDQLAVLADRDVAFAAARQHDLEPVSVH